MANPSEELRRHSYSDLGKFQHQKSPTLLRAVAGSRSSLFYSRQTADKSIGEYILRSLAELEYPKEVSIEYLRNITFKDYIEICWFLLEKLVGAINRPKAGLAELRYIKEKVIALGCPLNIPTSQLVTPYSDTSRPFAHSLLQWLCREAIELSATRRPQVVNTFDNRSSSEETVAEAIPVTKSGFPDLRTKAGKMWIQDQVLRSNGNIPGWVEKRDKQTKLSAISKHFYKIYDKFYPSYQAGQNLAKASNNG